MIQTLQKCLKSFKVISFKCQNVSGRIDIKLLIMIVAENVGSNSSRFSRIFSGCSHCQWSAPTEAAEATPREQKCLGIMSPGAGLMGTWYKYSSFPSWNGDSLSPEVSVELGQSALCTTLLSFLPGPTSLQAFPGNTYY